mgnify:CR=1 FL=1|tara:strand:+ start:7855 stop:8940 length:1086 start_codon:yes stop_codon:yes gene_type:complete
MTTSFYSNDAGNVNWNNHKTGDSFKPPIDAKNQFNIDRPSFDSGPIYEGKTAQSIDNIDKRSGLGNRLITRPSFLSPPSLPRKPISFNVLQALDIQNFGAKVRLGQDQLDKLIMISIPDPLDTRWVKENTRLINELRLSGMSEANIKRELKVNKPLGRSQRTTSMPSKNVAREQQLSFKQKLVEIKQEVDNGFANSRTERATLIGQISAMLQEQDTKSSDLYSMTNMELEALTETLDELKVPKLYSTVFPDHRIIAGSGQYFSDNKGLIAMYLMSNLPSDRSPNKPILSWHTGHARYEPTSLLQIYQMGTSRFLDMKNRVIDTTESLSIKGLAPPISSSSDSSLSTSGNLPSFDLSEVKTQ